MKKSPLKDWHKAVSNQDVKLMKTLLAKDSIFYSPVVFKPQEGKSLVGMYLAAAFKMFADAESFEYIKEIVQENQAVLEFSAVVEGVTINGIDMMTWGDDGLISEFKVMVRPLKGIDKIKEKMMEQLKDLSTFDKLKIKIGL